ncbi:histidine phosphatase family protein [Chloroflexota bacterium]
MSKILLVRHGVTEYNSLYKFCGYSDIDLNAHGFKQVEKLRNRLANEKIDAVYSSDLKRAVSTAKIVSSEHNVELATYPELREISYGHLEGLTFEEIKNKYPEVAESITNFNLSLSFPGGESFTEFIARTLRFMEKLNEHTEEQTILIASHGGPLTTLVCELLGISQSHWRAFHIDNASLSIIHTYPNRGLLTLFNDTSHLKEKD